MFDTSFIHASAFNELTALLIMATLIGLIGTWLRQPMIVSFIFVGMLAGPSGFSLVQSHDNIELLSELGVAVLLFLVGLKLDLKLIRTMGWVSLATGLGQVVFTAVIGYFIGLALGYDAITSTYIAVALTFSSTIIIVKLLSDKREVDSLYGRIAIGFLIVQDLVVVFAMMVLSTMGIGASAASHSGFAEQAIVILIGGLVLLLFLLIFIRYLATPLMNQIAYSPELMIIFAIGWAAFWAFLGNYWGFSKELGGLLAGISLASTPYRDAIVSRLASVRDFLLLFFFIALGSQIDLSIIDQALGSAVVFSLFVLIGNPLIVLIIMGLMGYRKRTSFLAGLTVAQISEFSLIFMAMGLTLGHVSREALGLVTLVGIITIAISVYMITYSHVLYAWFAPALSIFERKLSTGEVEDYQDGRLQGKHYDIVLFGLGRYGSAIGEHLIRANYKVLAVDYNPDEVHRWQQLGYQAIYGDASDVNFIASLPLSKVKWVVNAIPQHALGVTHDDPRLLLLEGLRIHHYKGKIAVSTQYLFEMDLLRTKGFDLVFLPFYDAAEKAVENIIASSG